MSLQQGLIGHWKLDGVDAKDSSAYDRHGTIEGDVNTEVPGEVDKAFDFVNGAVKLGSNDDKNFAPSDAFTVCFWLNLDFVPTQTNGGLMESPSTSSFVRDYTIVDGLLKFFWETQADIYGPEYEITSDWEGECIMWHLSMMNKTHTL